MNSFQIETKNLILRHLKSSDVDGIFELDSNPKVHKYLGNQPITTKKEAEEIIAFVKQQYKERGIGRFAAIEKATGEFIGWSGLKLNSDKKEALNGKQNFYDIGYRFIPKFWGKGYGTESALACLDFGFNQLNLDVICGAAEVDNIASNKILRKIGLQFVNEFYFESVMANWYELKKEDYAKTMS